MSTKAPNQIGGNIPYSSFSLSSTGAVSSQYSEKWRLNGHTILVVIASRIMLFIVGVVFLVVVFFMICKISREDASSV